jgi:hypothetical protein
LPSENYEIRRKTKKEGMKVRLNSVKSRNPPSEKFRNPHSAIRISPSSIPFPKIPQSAFRNPHFPFLNSVSENSAIRIPQSAFPLPQFRFRKFRNPHPAIRISPSSIPFPKIPQSVFRNPHFPFRRPHFSFRNPQFPCPDLGRGLEFGLEMSGEPEGQSDNRQGRIGKTASGKNRAPGQEKILHVMHPAIGIDHPVPGIVVHPGSAQEVMRAVELPGLRANTFFHGNKSANAGGSQFLPKNLLRLTDTAQIQLVPAPEHLYFALAEAIDLLLQHDAVRAVRRLFDKGMDSKCAKAAFQAAESRPSALTL